MGRWGHTVTISAEVNLGDVETEDLVEELHERWDEMSKKEKEKVKPFITDNTEGWQPTNLDHKMKFELFLKHIDDYFYTEFEKRLTAPPVELWDF